MNNIIQGFPIPQKDYYKVYVRSITFNQAPYIEDCLNGVAMQETNFPFVHHVIDDASTDGEQEVIKTWMDKNCDMENAENYDNDICTITMVKNKKNPNCTLAAYFLKKNLHKEKAKKRSLFNLWREVCPYEAICEGDDYWIDPKKLQKQVDWLDEHPDCTLCYHACKNKFEEGFKGIMRPYGENVKESYSMSDILKKYNFQTATIVFRRFIIESEFYRGLTSVGFSFGDALIYYTAGHFGQVEGFNEQMSVYRRVNSGISNTICKSKIRYSDTIKFFDILYLFNKEEQKLLLKKIQNFLLDLASLGQISFKQFWAVDNMLFHYSFYHGRKSLEIYMKSQILRYARNTFLSK